MIKILKKLIKRNFELDKKYVLIYQRSIYSEYEFIRCDEYNLKRILEQEEMFNYHIFLSKDELEFETEIDFGSDRDDS